MTDLAWRDVRFVRGGRSLLVGITAEARTGEVLGIVGPNGAGKSTLLKIAAGLLPASGGAVLQDGEPIAALTPRQRAKRLAYLPQQAESHWPISVRHAVLLGRIPHLGNFAGPDAADLQAVERAMAFADVSDLAERRLDSLSGGERALALLARALAVEAAILLADEPTASLDPYHQLAVMDLFRRLAAEGRTVLVALHDLALAARYCDRLLVLKSGRVERIGPPAEALDDAILAGVYRIEALRADRDGAHLLLPWARLGPDAGDGP